MLLLRPLGQRSVPTRVGVRCHPITRSPGDAGYPPSALRPTPDVRASWHSAPPQFRAITSSASGSRPHNELGCRGLARIEGPSGCGEHRAGPRLHSPRREAAVWPQHLLGIQPDRSVEIRDAPHPGDGRGRSGDLSGSSSAARLARRAGTAAPRRRPMPVPSRRHDQLVERAPDEHVADAAVPATAAPTPSLTPTDDPSPHHPEKRLQ